MFLVLPQTVRYAFVRSRPICPRCLQLRQHASWPWCDTSRKRPSWSKAVSDAEKIVGYPTSFMSLRCLLSDEISNVAMLMRKLVGTRHPLLKTARGLVVDGKYNMQTRGLIVLLISKSAGAVQSVFHNSSDPDIVDGIHKSQRTLAEITEMIYTANLIHKGVINLSALTPEDGPAQDMEFGNKMAVLSGDFLLASACTGLAELNNTKVVENISLAIGNLMESEFTDLRDKDGKPVLPTSIRFDDWMQQTFLASGSLLARSCQSAMELCNHDKQVLHAAFTFGENMAYAHQMQEDLKPFLNPQDHLPELTLTSAPVIKYLEHSQTPIDTFNFKKIVSLVKESKAVEECEQLCLEYGEKAKAALNVFPKSDAHNALINIVNATAVS
ncbi:all trans-polyprenyl-diphosphate synthase PDSS2-like [Ylistrum balloti]|uniref:all trans-polyprenyl-diphosphate synthase PDSS2-like n=1 Tax=Ylistrum balloti TaxID=509963 RepID=UPI0029057EC9|nr:all trans-polyprenyl-diphosphate synthase PDSS2-like [Ylistrum balloti]